MGMSHFQYFWLKSNNILFHKNKHRIPNVHINWCIAELRNNFLRKYWWKRTSIPDQFICTFGINLYSKPLILQKAISYFFGDFNFKTQSLWFKKALYCFLLIQCCYWLFYYDLLFGVNSIVYTRPYSIGFFKDLAFFLYNRSSPLSSLWFIILLICLCGSALLKFRIHFVFDLVIWWIVLNIHNKIYPTLTGGDYLLNQLLFFTIFITDKFNSGEDKKGQIVKCLHNFGVLAIMIQVCIVYFFSAITKLTDANWLNGTAIIMTSQVDHFSLPFVSDLAKNSGWLFVIMNYIVLIYQALFPLVVWIKKIKKPFIIIGVLMHLYIAFIIGLVSFGLIMILCYIYFWPEKKKLWMSPFGVSD